MELKLTNENYHGKVVEITNIIPIEGKDRIVSTDIFGNNVIISKDVNIGDVGIFFPAETKLSSEYLHYNSLFRDKTKNKDQNKAGFFEDNGRIKCLSLGKTPSMGLFMPLSSLDYHIISSKLKVGDKFNEINGKLICEKYIIIQRNQPSQGGGKEGKKQKKLKKISKLIEDQFILHYDTNRLGDNIHMIAPDDIITISYKLHGTSAVFSNILCKRKLSLKDKIAKFFGAKVQDTQYDYVYASRNTIKNEDMNPNALHYYKTDIWGVVNEEIKNKISKGMTIYGEIVGFLPDGGSIQKMNGKPFDYGCDENKHAFYVYRIKYTNPDGVVYEFSMKHVQLWCEANGMKCVPILFHGKASELVTDTEHHFHENLLQSIKEKFNEKDCFMCKNVLPEEGVVVRIEGKIGAFKQKSFRFMKGESEQLDTGEVDIESIQ